MIFSRDELEMLVDAINTQILHLQYQKTRALTTQRRDELEVEIIVTDRLLDKVKKLRRPKMN